MFTHNLNKKNKSNFTSAAQHNGKRGKSSNPDLLNSNLNIQAKLTVGQPNDKYEQEADRVANQVMRMPANDTVQRSCSSCMKEENSLQTKPLYPQISPYAQRQQIEEEEALIQSKITEGITPEVTPSISSGIKSLQGGGQPLSGAERVFFEPRFGFEFSGVRVHNDMRAAHIARSVNARAFTSGQNVVFGTAEYSPGASSGRKLLAHELTHVVQQNQRRLPRFVADGDFGNKMHKTVIAPQTDTHAAIDKRVESETMRLLDEGNSEHLRRQPETPKTAQPDEEEKTGYTQCDFIHDTIDVDAQKSLYHLYKKGGTERSSAFSIWAAVKNGKLSGIYQQNRTVPAKMARKHGSDWWTMITNGNAMVFPEEDKEFPKETPILVYKKSLASNIPGLAKNLQEAWSKRPDFAPGSIPDPTRKICPIIVTPSSTDELSGPWKEIIPYGLRGRCVGANFSLDPITDKCGNTIIVYCKSGSWHINFTNLSGNTTQVGKCVYDPAENILQIKRGIRSKCFTRVRHRTESRDTGGGSDSERWQHTETDVRKGKSGAPEGWCRKGKKHPYDWNKDNNDTCKDKWW